MQRANAISNNNFNNISTLKKNQKITTGDFKATILNAPIDNLIKELTKKFNINISAKSVSKDIQSILSERKTLNFKNVSRSAKVTVIIAPNILKEMASNSKEKEYVEKTIQDFFVQRPSIDSSLSARGKKAIPSLIVFHADGTWTESGGSVPTPEKLAEIKKDQATKQKGNLKQSYTEYYYKTSDQNNLKDNSNIAMNYLLNQYMNNLFSSSVNGIGNFDNSGAMNNLIALSLYKAYSKLHSKNPNQTSFVNSNNMAMDYLLNQSVHRIIGNRNISNLHS